MEIINGKYITRFAFWNPATWSIPSLYWDTMSQEQRYHAICRQLSKIIQYADYLGINVDDIAGRLEAIEKGELNDFIVQAIEDWFNDNQPAIVSAIAALNDALPISDFDSINTVKKYVDDTATAIQGDISDLGALLPDSDYSLAYTVSDAFTDMKSIIDKKIFVYDTVSDMIADSAQFYVGAICKTNGFYSINDGGAATYYINDTGSANGFDILTCGDYFAFLICKDSVRLAQLGINGNNDATDGINYALTNYETVICEDFEIYDVSDVIFIHDDNKFIGNNSKLVWTNSISDNTHWRFGTDSAASNFLVKGIIFDISTPANSPKSMSVIGSHNFKFVDCEFIHGTGYMIRCTDTVSGVFKNCYFHDIQSGDTSVPAGGIYGQHITNLNVIDCKFETIGDHGVYFDGDTNPGNDNNTVKDCVFFYCGIETITNGAAITVYSNSKNTRISNNTFVECNIGVFVGYHGSYSINPINTNISDNIIIGNNVTTIGICIQGGSSENNYFVRNVIVSNNMVSNTISDSISLRTINGANICGNTMYDSGRSGIECANIDSISFTANVFRIENVSANTSPMLILGANRLTDNHCYNCKVDGNSFINDSGTQRTAISTRLTNRTTTVLNNTFKGDCIYSQAAYANKMYSQVQSTINKCSIAFADDPSNLTELFGVGDICFNNNPSTAGDTVMWVCTTAGTPGSWESVVTRA